MKFDTSLVNPSRKRRWQWLILALLLLIALGVAWQLKNKASKPTTTTQTTTSDPNSTKPALTVQAVQAGASNWQGELVADGKITAWQEASISAQGAGLKIAQVNAQVGDTVRAGQTLVTFETSTVQGDINGLIANSKEAQANLTDAQINFSKAEGLKAAGAISDQQYRQFKTALISAQARMDAASAAQKAGVTRNTLTAPNAGVISSKTATIGTVVQPGQELFRMVVDGRLEWQAELTAAQMGNVKVGTTARVTLGDGTELTGEVRRVSPVLNTATNTATVYVRLNSTGNARAGMFAKGVFVQSGEQSLTVPQTALLLRDGFTYVYKINGEQNDTRVQLVKVTTGARQDGQVAILSGVNPAETLVASGVEFLKDGDLVKVVQ